MSFDPMDGAEDTTSAPADDTSLGKTTTEEEIEEAGLPVPPAPTNEAEVTEALEEPAEEAADSDEEAV